MGEKDGAEEQEQSRIKVVDRRQFTAEGERRDDAPPEQEREPATAPREHIFPSAGQQQQPSTAGFEHRPVNEPEGVSFTMLINAMAHPALLFLGEIANPNTNEPTIDLTQARLQIDMLDLLKVKCRGNLTPQEEGLLDRVLYQLRMLYVSRSSAPDEPG